MVTKKKVHEEASNFRDRARRGKKEKEERGRFKFLPNQDNKFRILQTPAGEASPDVFMYFKMHDNVGPKDGWARCGKNINGKGECWLCDVVIPKLKRQGKNKTAAKLTPSDKFVVQVAAVDDDGEWRGPLLYTTSAGKSSKSMSYIMESLIQNTKRDFVDHKKGYCVSIERTGTGMTDTRYGAPVYDDEPTKVPIGIVNKLRPFDEVVSLYDEERQKAVYYGREMREEEEEEEPKKKRGRDVEEEEEEEQEEETESESEEEEEESEEEEEESKPKKKKPVKKSKVEDEDEGEGEEEEEDEEEEEEESEEEEEPKPKKKKPVKKAKDEDEDAEEDEEEGEEDEESSEDEDTSDSDDGDESEEEDEEEEEAPKKKKPVAKKKAKPSKDEDEDEDESEEESEEDESEEEEEEEEESEEESEEDESEEEEEEEEPAPKKKPVKKSLKKKH